MATRAKKAPPKTRAPAANADASNRTRVYMDLQMDVAVELAVLAARNRMSKKAYVELLVLEASRRTKRGG